MQHRLWGTWGGFWRTWCVSCRYLAVAKGKSLMLPVLLWFVPCLASSQGNDSDQTSSGTSKIIGKPMPWECLEEFQQHLQGHRLPTLFATNMCIKHSSACWRNTHRFMRCICKHLCIVQTRRVTIAVLPSHTHPQGLQCICCSEVFMIGCHQHSKSLVPVISFVRLSLTLVSAACPPNMSSTSILPSSWFMAALTRLKYLSTSALINKDVTKKGRNAGWELQT